MGSSCKTASSRSTPSIWPRARLSRWMQPAAASLTGIPFSGMPPLPTLVRRPAAACPVAWAWRGGAGSPPCGFGWPPPGSPRGGLSSPGGLAGRAVITHVRFRLPRPWKPVLGYLDLERRCVETGVAHPDARQIFDWVCDIRRAKLPHPAVLGNVGRFFKNPTVSPDQCADIIARHPTVVHYPMLDGSFKLAAGWLIEVCGWKGKTIGKAGVYEKQALVLVNRGSNGDSVTGGEVMTLAKAIQ